MGNVDYNAKVLDHFRNPRNMGRFARLQVAGGRWQVNVVQGNGITLSGPLCRPRLVRLNQVGYVYGKR